MSASEFKQAISELLERARQEGELDPYVGKRHWKRYRYGTRLEVTRDPAVFASSWYATTHNVSGGGIGFWSKQAFSLGDPLFVRERCAGKPGPWLPGHVRYCTLGVSGYLVGVSFDQPGDRDAGWTASSCKPVELPSSSCDRARVSYLCSSLRNRSGLVAVLVSLIVYFGTVSLCRQNLSDPSDLAVVVAGAIAVTMMSFGMGWLFMSRESAVLVAIRRAADELSSGSLDSSPLPETSTREVAAVRQVILDLGIRWRQQAELERLQRQRLEEISQIKTNVLSMVSHDLRTPLTSIHLYAQMLEEDLKDLDEGEQRKFLGVISEECTRLSRLVDDLLEVQRLERNNIDWPTQPHDLSETVRSVARAFEPIALNNGLQFDVQCPEKIMQVWVNPDKIAQAINNLLSNALKFTPSGGRIILAARFTNAEVVISVADTGPGIPREKWDAVFDRFVQISSDKVAASKGVGLGLYITRQIIERHKGRVWLDSEIGSGTEFFLALPICRTKPSSALVATPEYVAGQVVICDADPDLASVMAQELRGHGFEVRLAHCGSRFFEQIAERPPDVVICDVVLPDMSCQEFLDGLERVESRSFLLVLHSTGGTCEELKRLGANIVLSRPVSRSELVEAAGIAMYKRADRGAVVAMITGWGIDGDRMGQVLAAKGHLPVAVGDQTEAIESLRKYPVDAVIAFVGPEGAQSPKRHALECELPAGGHLFALTSIPDKSICQRDSTDAVTLLPYRPGQEELVAAEIDRLVGARKAEIVQ